MSEESNIISEEDFLRELGLGVQSPTVESKTTDDPIESALNDTLPKTEDTPPVTPPTTDAETPKEEEAPKEEEILEKEQHTLKRFGVRDTVSSLIDNGVWTDTAIKYNGKEYSSITELIEAEKPTKDLFDALSQAQKGLRDEELNSEYISIKGKDQTKVKLINAILSDVEYDDLLKYNQEVVQPTERLDFSNPENGHLVAEAFVRRCLMEIDGIPEKYINAELEELKRDFRLLEKAEEYQGIIKANFEQEIEIRETLKKQEQEERAKQLKTNMTSLRKTMKEQEFSDSFIQKALQLRFSVDDDGKEHYIKLIQDKVTEDKGFEARLLHFILDESDFISKAKAPAKTETAVKMLEIIGAAPKETAGGKVSKNPKNLETADENFLMDLGVEL